MFLSVFGFCLFFRESLESIQVVSPRVFIAAVAILGVLVGRLACSGSLACLTKVCSV